MLPSGYHVILGLEDGTHRILVHWTSEHFFVNTWTLLSIPLRGSPLLGIYHTPLKEPRQKMNGLALSEKKLIICINSSTDILTYLERIFTEIIHLLIDKLAGIYILAIPPPPGGGENFVQSEKQGRIWRRTWKKGKKRGKRRKKRKEYKTHFKIPLWSLNTAKKS